MCRDFLYRLHLWHLPVKEWKKAGKHAHIPHLTRLKLEIVINNNQATSLSPHWAVIAYRWKYNEHLIYVRQREMEMVMVVFGLGNTIRTVRMENNCIPSKVNFRLNFISFWFIFIHYALGGGALPQAKIAYVDDGNVCDYEIYSIAPALFHFMMFDVCFFIPNPNDPVPYIFSRN